MVGNWTEIIAFGAVVVVFFFLKICLVQCCLVLRKHENSRVTSSREADGRQLARQRHHATETDRSRHHPLSHEEPPSFQLALEISVPVAYVNPPEELPPSYDDYLKSINTFPHSDGTLSVTYTNDKIQIT